jgi:hypothetical protein
MPADPHKGTGASGIYLGPTSIAAAKITSVWKMPSNERRFMSDESGEEKNRLPALPETIMIPCEYDYEAQPSNLTAGRTYIVFLQSMGRNFYHPLDPASTHVIQADRVAHFGVNHPPGKDFPKKSSRLIVFGREVDSYLSRSGNQKQSMDRRSHQ